MSNDPEGQKMEEEARARLFGPRRECNGGPDATRRCGRTATCVGRRVDDPQLPPLEWFACDEHRGGNWTPIDEWFACLSSPAKEGR